MKLLSWFRVRWKQWLAHHRLIAEYCHRCGRRQPIAWTAPDQLWNDVTGQPNTVLCPDCFDRLAWSKGRHVYWWACEESDMLGKHRAAAAGKGEGK